jgi:iron complex transport system permease protein
MKLIQGKINNSQVFLYFLLLSALLVLFFFLNLVFGSIWIPVNDIWLVITNDMSSLDGGIVLIINNFRMPQALTAMLSGAGLAVAGLMMQTLFRNPLADPSILGISSGASLGVAMLLAVSGAITGHAFVNFGHWGQLGITGSAFVGALLVLLLILYLSRRMGNIISLLIIGIMIGYLAGALVGFVKYFSQRDDVHAFVIWGLGSFSNVGNEQMPYFSVLIIAALLLSWLLVKPLNLMLLGERYAANLGLNVPVNQLYIILVAGFLTATVTAYAGPIAFIGLAVPHLARNLFKTADHRILMPATILSGAVLALICNLIARAPGFDGSLPINAVTSLIGAPFVIYIILRRRHLYLKE